MSKLPPPFAIWENAMKLVDKDAARVKKDIVDWGYCVPELMLLVSRQTPQHHQLFMTNWLAIHPFWISQLNHDPPAQFPSPQQWREILHCVPSKDKLEAVPTSSMGNTSAAGHKLAVLEIFSDIMAAVSESTLLAPTQTVEWRRKYIPTTSLTNPPPHLIRAILWKVYEIGWHYKLCTLEQGLNPQLWAGHHMECLGFIQMLFPGSSCLVLWSEPLPSRAGDHRLTDSFTNNE